jgi:hypothetical protein
LPIRIGLPRGLLHYYYGRVWENFFHELGAEVVVSGETTKAMLNYGGILDEVCLPVKAYFGHEYRYLPNTSTIHEKTEEVITYYDENYETYYKDYSDSKDELIKQEVEEMIYNIYKEATDVNANSNFKKLGYIRLVGWLLIASLMIGTLTTVFYYCAKHIIITII